MSETDDTGNDTVSERDVVGIDEVEEVFDPSQIGGKSTEYRLPL